MTAQSIKNYHCGSLSYTKIGLVMLFAWLLWGDFCFMLMQTVVPSVLPLKLKALGGSDFVIAMIMTTLPSILNMTVCPYVSFKSDRYRSKWGRRIPFILCTLPFLVLCLVGLGFGENVADFLKAHVVAAAATSPATVAILVLGTFMVLFAFFDMFVASVFYYLFNDVVPPQFLGRFVGCFRIVSGLAAALYNYFVFRYAETHMREIFIGAAFMYLIGIGAMCFMVKEGEYPPVDESTQKRSRGLEGVKTFLKESFSCKFYLTKFFYTTTVCSAGVASTFLVFFYKDMGLTLDDIGKANGILAMAGIGAMYFAAIFVDRWHPLRMIAYSSVFSVIFGVAPWVWIFVSMPPHWFFWLYLMGMGMILAFYNQLYGAAAFPADMRLHPKSRFGQFCSAQALLRSCGVMLSGLLFGVIFDALKKFFPESPEFAYRFIFAWTAVCYALAAFFAIWLYAQWRERGGDERFSPPAPWSPSGVEEEEQAPFVGPQTRWLKLALHVMTAVFAVSLLYLIPEIWWLKRIGWSAAASWHLTAILPCAAILLGGWLWTAWAVKRDIALVKKGESPKLGIPHHGVPLAMSFALLALLGIWIGMTLAAIHFDKESSAIVFGVGNLITNALLLGAMNLLRWVERGYPAMLDYDGRKETVETPDA